MYARYMRFGECNFDLQPYYPAGDRVVSRTSSYKQAYSNAHGEGAGIEIR